MSKILVIDDNEANLYLMAYLLRAAGYEVLTANDGQAGIKTALERIPDLIVCDGQMPEMDGYEVARELKQNPVLRQTPLISVTAYAMTGDREKSLAAGFDGYLPKPIDPETFARQIAAYMRQPTPE